jgi:hypothetical protein
MNQHPISLVRCATGRHLTTCAPADSENAKIAAQSTVARTTQFRKHEHDRIIIVSLHANYKYLETM